jgi:GT2 family glycosyltransferase
MLELSIVLPTCNRAAILKKCLADISSNVRCEHEIIVVDGASSDGTSDVLAQAYRKLGDRLRIIREPRREGFVKAANKGFRAARGKFMTWLNDDARPLPGALDNAIQQLTALPDTVAFVAMFHRWNSNWNVAYQNEYRGKMYCVCHVRGTMYANFPMGRREVYERLGFFDERFYVCAADPDLSLKAWYAGMTIQPAWNAMIDHDEMEDDRRTADSTRAREDNRKLFEKWEMPARNPYKNDFDPRHPCTVKTLESVLNQPKAA